jgi:F-type H+-transporting ATPase subunit gamma
VPAAQQREIQQRIRTVQSTRKITRAMEMIAASRIVRAQRRVAAARPYAEKITRVVGNLVAGGATDHPLLRTRPRIRRVGLVVLAADRGLAGAYNTNVLRMAERRLRNVPGGGKHGYALFLVGRKAQSYFRYRGYAIHHGWEGMSDAPTYEDARRVAAEVMAAYEAGEVDAVEVVSTQFLSAATQRVTLRRLLPVEGFDGPPGRESAGEEGPRTRYELEPGEPAAILDGLLPRSVEARLLAALLDAAASEHAARQRAMKAATDNADDLVKTLRRVANETRQEQITTEIMEIVGGAEALRSGASPASPAASDHRAE